MNDIIDKIFGFITGLGVITGGLISIAWFAGSLLVYCLLDRPIWEKAILLGITIFIFIWFCVSTIRKRKPKSNSNKRSDGSMLDEHLQELKGVLDEIDEELSEAHCVRDEEKIKELEDSRKDILSQIEGYQIEDKVEKLRRLKKEAIRAGRKIEAEEYSKQIGQYENKLAEGGDRFEDLPRPLEIFAYFMLGSFVISFALMYLLVPMLMILLTWVFWEAWTGGSEWMRSPSIIITLIFCCLALSSVAVRYASGFFSPEK